MTDLMTSVLNFFYPPFRRLMPLQTFRYAACGSLNVGISYLVFALIYHFVGKMVIVNLGILVLKPYRFSLLISSSVSFVIGFLLNKYIVFTKSTIKGRIQLFRYFLSFLFSFFANNVLLQAFVESLHLHPVLAQFFVTLIVVGISYLIQHYYTFKIKEKD
jgi:putative flippase GtrA